MKKLLLGFMVVLLGFSACASFNQNQRTMQLTVQYATLKYLEKFDVAERPAHVQRIKDIAAAVKAVAAGTQAVSVVLLQDAVNVQLEKAGLSPADRLLASGLVQMLVQEIQARVGTGLLKSDEVVQVVQVLDWVSLAAGAAG